MSELGNGIVSAESILAEQCRYPVDAWQTAAAFKVLQASGEASLLKSGLAGLAGMAHALAGHLLQAQAWYEEVDARIVETFSELSDTVTAAIVIGVVDVGLFSAGALAAALMTPGGLALLLAGAVVHHGLEKSGLTVNGEDVAGWLETNQHTLANPVMVMFVRALVSGGDEIVTEVSASVAGAAGAAVLGPVGVIAAQAVIRQGVKSPQSVAGSFADIIQRANGSHRYEIGHTEREPAPRPESIGELMHGIPKTEADGTHVTISEYRKPDGQSVYVVSVAGTSSTGFGGENAMDNLSNLAAYAGQDDETIGATIMAMEAAGISSGDAVVFSGYSQGALVAATLAASDEWQTQSVLLAGSPIHGNEIGGGVPVIQLEHAGDLITGLQGFAPAAAGEVAVVHRDPYPNGVPQDQGVLGPHTLQNYRDTAVLYDAHSDPASRANRGAVLDPFVNATPVATHDFHLHREYANEADAEPSRTTSPEESGSPLLLPNLGSLVEQLGEHGMERVTNPLGSPVDSVGFLGVDRGLEKDSLEPKMPDAYRVEMPRPGI